MTNSESLATQVYKLLNPTSRVVGLIKNNSTGSRGQRVCVICGEGCPGWSAKYARTKQSIKWEAGHDCSAQYLADHGFAGAALDKALALVEQGAEAAAVLADFVKLTAVAS